jgi:hypothetical protein
VDEVVEVVVAVIMVGRHLPVDGASPLLRSTTIHLNLSIPPSPVLVETMADRIPTLSNYYVG